MTGHDISKADVSCVIQWASDLACQLLAIHNEEVARRRDFQSQFEGHFLSTLFPGMEDLPPPFATQAPAPFDLELPQVGFNFLCY
jgi:RB1-inducible coiled-coil protein 1